MLPVVDPTGSVTGQMAVLYALALLPVGVMAAMAGLTGWLFAAGSLGLGVGAGRLRAPARAQLRTERRRPPPVPRDAGLPAAPARPDGGRPGTRARGPPRGGRARSPMTHGRTFLRSGGWVVVAALAVTTCAFAFYAANLLRGRGLARGRRRTTRRELRLLPRAVPGSPRPDRRLRHAQGRPAGARRARTWTLRTARRGAARRGKMLVPATGSSGSGWAARRAPTRSASSSGTRSSTTRSAASRSRSPTRRCATAPSCFAARSADGTLTFGVSGPALQLQPPDVRPPARGRGESLWSQLLLRAVAGPAAAGAATLEVLPPPCTSWARTGSPATPPPPCSRPTPAWRSSTGATRTSRYFGSDMLRFPVAAVARQPEARRSRPRWWSSRGTGSFLAVSAAGARVAPPPVRAAQPGPMSSRGAFVCLGATSRRSPSRAPDAGGSGCLQLRSSRGMAMHPDDTAWPGTGPG